MPNPIVGLGAVLVMLTGGANAATCGGVVKFQDGVTITSGTIFGADGSIRGRIISGDFSMSCPDSGYEMLLLNIPFYSISAKVIVVASQVEYDRLATQQDLSINPVFIASDSMEITTCKTDSPAVPGYLCAGGILLECPETGLGVDATSDTWDLTTADAQCYVPSGQSVTDENGNTWEYTVDCSYGNSAR